MFSMRRLLDVNRFLLGFENVAVGFATLALACTSLTAWMRPLGPPGATHYGRASGSSGTIYYHFDLPIKSTQQAADSLVLDGDNYTDLIMSSYVGGALLGRTIGELYPGVQFDKDYLYGTLWGQLLQENIETGLYEAGQELIDPSPLQQAVMGVGQGGPFQINNYDVDLVYGSYAPQGFAMLNYDEIQANIGFYVPTSAPTVEESDAAIVQRQVLWPGVGGVFPYERPPCVDATGHDRLQSGARFHADKATFKPPLVDHVVFDTSELGTVYTNVMASLAYVDGAGRYGSIPPQVAAHAYASALAGAGNPTSLDLSAPAQRAVIFRVLENALAKTEQRLGARFSATTLVQL
jgi:hypothetical protein